MCELLPVPVAAVFFFRMKGLMFGLFNTLPGRKAAPKEEEKKKTDREETRERGAGEGIGLTAQRDTEGTDVEVLV